MGWNKASDPILTATLTAENHSVDQPRVMYENGIWRMWYSGGWGGPSLFYAECAGDPMIAANWVKLGLLWHGTDFGDVTKRGNIYLLATAHGDNVYLAAHTDPKHINVAGDPWWEQRIVIPRGATNADYHCLAPSLVFDADDPFGLVHLYYVAADQGYTKWKQYRAEGYSGAFTKKGLVSSLQLGSGSYGITGNIQKLSDGKFHAWQHNAPTGSTPTDIYHWVTDDLTTNSWVVLNGGQPVLARTLPWEIAGEQVADAHAIEVNGKSYLFYDATNNSNGTARIGVASFDGPLVSAP